MNNFSKLLLDKEELKLIIKPQTNNIKVYFIYFFIVLGFFLLYPMLLFGKNGLIMWLLFIIYLVVLLAQTYISKLNFYLLTNKRIIYVKALNREKFIFQGAVYLKNIDEIKNSGKRNICLYLDERKFYLYNIKDRDEIYKKIENML